MMEGGMAAVGSMGGYGGPWLWILVAFVIVAIVVLVARRKGD